jgi:hypothetical protein
MLQKIIVFCLSLFLLIPIVSIHAFTGDVELVLEDVGIVPTHPKNGDLVSITADIYNAGSKNTDSLTSLITVAYFVDGNLLHIDEIGNIEPGISNKIKITSPQIWKYDVGYHDITVIIDYHDTLNDQYDSPLNNSIDQNLIIIPPKNTEILLEANPQYFLLGAKTSKVTMSLFDSDSFEFLNDKTITLSFDGNESDLLTDSQGKISFSNTLPSSNHVNIEASFDGADDYSSTHSSLTLYQFPPEVFSSLVLKLSDSELYDFENNSFEILIYEDSYEKLIKKIQPDSTTLFDSETFWVSLSPGNNYFAEIYLDGRIFFVTDNDLLQEGSVIVKKIKVPEMGKIKFVVTDEMDQLVTDSVITNWIYTYSAADGFTEWVDVIPAIREPYVAKAVLSDERVIKSEPFLVFPGERKIIEISTANTLQKYEIPSWIKNNAGWWADGLIDDSSFVEGMQFLIQEGMINLS